MPSFSFIAVAVAALVSSVKAEAGLTTINYAGSDCKVSHLIHYNTLQYPSQKIWNVCTSAELTIL
jgi:hypothetical protein